MKKDAKTKTVTGTVLSAKKIWCIHINRHPLLPTDRGGALFPYMVEFQFESGGKTYTCKKRSDFLAQSPRPGDLVAVAHEEGRPEKCRIKILPSPQTANDPR